MYLAVKLELRYTYIYTYIFSMALPEPVHGGAHAVEDLHQLPHVLHSFLSLLVPAEGGAFLCELPYDGLWLALQLHKLLYPVCHLRQSNSCMS